MIYNRLVRVIYLELGDTNYVININKIADILVCQYYNIVINKVRQASPLTVSSIIVKALAIESRHTTGQELCDNFGSIKYKSNRAIIIKFIFTDHVSYNVK